MVDFEIISKPETRSVPKEDVSFLKLLFYF